MKKKKTIVFYFALEPMIISYKMARSLKKKGYKKILFSIAEKHKIDFDFYKKAFDEIYCSDFEIRKLNLNTIPYIVKNGPHFINFLLKTKQIKADVIVGIAGVNWQMKYLRKYFFKKTPFIFYTHDILSHFFKTKEEAFQRNVKNFELKAEKYNYEHCDGFMHKGDPNELEILPGRVHEKINFPKHQLTFNPYCSKEFFVPINKNKLSKKDNELHIVYVGFFWTDQAEAGSNFFCKLLDQKIHVHIYQKGLAYHLPKDKEKDYVNSFFYKCMNHPYFHVHDTLPAKDLIPEISKYDYGIFPFIPISENNLEPTFCASNKIASYLEAGIPPLVDKRLAYLDKLLKSYGLDIGFDDSDLEKIGKKLKKLDYNKLIKNVEKMRNEFSVEENIDKFIDFTEKVIKESRKAK